MRDALRAALVAHGALADSRRPCGAKLPLPHAYALIELLHHGPMTVNLLAQRLHIDRTNVSRLTARMETAGELRRIADPQDRRARELSLTLKGLELAREVDASSAAHFSLLANALSDLQTTVGALQELGDAMESLKTSKPPIKAGT